MAQENSIVLIYVQNKPQFYARIEEINPDVKPDWYNVTIKPLYIDPNSLAPAENFIWTIRDVYIEGEPFTMNGTEIQIVEIPPIAAPDYINTSTNKSNGEKGEKESEEIQVQDGLLKEFNDLKKQTVVDFEKFKRLRKEIFTSTQDSTA